MPSLPEPGTEWAGFHIEGQIGEGGFGRVFTAWDSSLDRRVAIKVLVGPGPGTDVDDTVRERFLRESRIAARLDHPRIVPIFQADEIDGVPYIVMRHVGGGDLREEIRNSPLTLDRTVSVIGQVASALDRAHRSGLVHRDVKPANILCAEGSDDIYLTDFGITRFMEESTDEGLTLTGHAPPASPHYASPEQLRGEPLGPTADVYSLGCTLFECLTGRVPFTGGTSLEVAHHQLQTDPPSVTAVRPDLPAELDRIVARAMAKDPAARHPTGAALAEALASAGGPVSPSAPVAATLPAVDPTPVRAGRSVFDLDPDLDPGPTADPDFTHESDRGRDPDATVDGLPVTAASGPGVTEPSWAEPPPDPADDATGVYPVAVAVPPEARRPDGTVDGSVFGVYEDDTPRSRAPLVIALVVIVLALAVGGLVWRAVNTDADLSVPAEASSTTTQPEDTGPQLEALATLVPESITTCGPPAEQPTDEPRRVVLQCPLDDEPDHITFELYEDVAARDQRFDDIVAFSGLPTTGTECALGQSGVHRFAGARQSGRLACRIDSGTADLVWTDDAQPVLTLASGRGRYRDDYSFFVDLVGRTDDNFPLPVETELMARLPDELTVGCRRDVDLTVDAHGVVAVACEPPDQEAAVVSWVRFGSPDAMAEWIDARRAGLTNTFGSNDDACTPKGFGKAAKGVDDKDKDKDDDEKNGDEGNGAGGEDPPAPDAGFTDYERDGTKGRILCFVNASRQNAIFWTRTGELIGSIAVSTAEDRDMADLLRWWERDGHKP